MMPADPKKMTDDTQLPPKRVAGVDDAGATQLFVSKDEPPPAAEPDKNATIGVPTSSSDSMHSHHHRVMTVSQVAEGMDTQDFGRIAPKGTEMRLGNHSYILEDHELGQGGQGKVLLAYDKLLQREVAIKRANDSKQGSTGKTKGDGLILEAQAIANMHHPHIVPIHAVEQQDGILWYVYEYIDGGSLEDLVRKHKNKTLPDDAPVKLDPQSAVKVVSAIASALAKVHSKGYIHRDVKPANILLTQSGHPYLADFGVACSTAPGRKPEGLGQFSGTVSYMSPEQARAGLELPTSIDQRSDIYSLGVVLHEMLSGGEKLYPQHYLGKTPGTLDGIVDDSHIEPGKKKEPILDIARRIVTSEPVPPPKSPDGTEIPPELLRICAKALEKDPQKRYQKVAEMQHDLDKYLQDAIKEEALRAEREKTDRERAAERAEREKADMERAEREKAEREKIEQERAELAKLKAQPVAKPQSRKGLKAALATGVLALGVGIPATVIYSGSSNRPQTRDDTPTQPVATAPDTSAGEPPPKKKYYKTTAEDLRKLREWKVDGKKVNLMMLLASAYEDSKSPSANKMLKVRNDAGMIEEVPNNYDNYMRVVQNAVAGEATERQYNIILTRLLGPTEQIITLALRDDVEGKILSLPPEEYKAFLEKNGLKDIPETKEKLIEGLKLMDDTVNDWRHYSQERLNELQKASVSASSKGR